jgi:type I restriction enzyme S subunit
MKVILEKINLNNLDKSNWESFRFEEITFRVSEGVDPNTTTLEKYVGLEHIDANNIHIKRFGIPDDVSGGKLKCYPGDVIFGKRRAYQRKAAIADFEGICSAHAFVFRANPEIIDPKLFPFFLHSDQFMHRAVDISVGGLSPTINWGDLKGQEFLLPPKSDQSRLADLLWAMDEVIEKEILNLKLLELNYSTLVNSIYKYTTKRIKLQEIKFESFKGVSALENENGDSCLIPSGGVFPGFLKESKIKKVNINYETNNSKLIKNGDILFNTGGVGTLGRSHFFESKQGNYYCDTFVLVLRFLDNNYLGKFIYHILQSNSILGQINQHTKGTTGITSISIDGIRKFKIPNLILSEQKKFTKKLDIINSLIIEFESKIQYSQSLQKSLINQIF